MFPRNENPSSTHFVNATELARANATINIHALYSKREMRAARAAYLEQKQATVARLTSAYAVKGFLSFNDQLQYLWGDIPRTVAMLSEDADGKLALPECAAFVSNMLSGDTPEPATYKQAFDQRNPECRKWLTSMGKERGTREQRGTWELVLRISIGKHRPVH